MDGLVPTRTVDGRLYERYDGPDHDDGSRLHGRWFLRGGTPSRYYRDVRIDAARLQSLPEEGEPEALVQVALLAIPTLGLPHAVQALTWIEDLLDAREQH